MISAALSSPDVLPNTAAVGNAAKRFEPVDLGGRVSVAGVPAAMGTWPLALTSDRHGLLCNGLLALAD